MCVLCISGSIFQPQNVMSWVRICYFIVNLFFAIISRIAVLV